MSCHPPARQVGPYRPEDGPHDRRTGTLALRRPTREAVRQTTCEGVRGQLWIPGQPDRTPLLLGRELLDLATGHLDGRRVHLVGDAAYIGKPLRELPAHVTVTARLPADAALYQPAPPQPADPAVHAAKATGCRS